jgi:hypothetical protein
MISVSDGFPQNQTSGDAVGILSRGWVDGECGKEGGEVTGKKICLVKRKIYSKRKNFIFLF